MRRSPGSNIPELLFIFLKSVSFKLFLSHFYLFSLILANGGWKEEKTVQV